MKTKGSEIVYARSDGPALNLMQSKWLPVKPTSPGRAHPIRSAVSPPSSYWLHAAIRHTNSRFSVAVVANGTMRQTSSRRLLLVCLSHSLQTLWLVCRTSSPTIDFSTTDWRDAITSSPHSTAGLAVRFLNGSLYMLSARNLLPLFPAQRD